VTTEFTARFDRGQETQAPEVRREAVREGGGRNAEAGRRRRIETKPQGLEKGRKEFKYV